MSFFKIGGLVIFIIFIAAKSFQIILYQHSESKNGSHGSWRSVNCFKAVFLLVLDPFNFLSPAAHTPPMCVRNFVCLSLVVYCNALCPWVNEDGYSSYLGRECYFAFFVRVLVLAVISYLFLFPFLLTPWAGCALCLSHVLPVFIFFFDCFPLVFKNVFKNNGLFSFASSIGV